MVDKTKDNNQRLGMTINHIFTPFYNIVFILIFEQDTD